MRTTASASRFGQLAEAHAGAGQQLDDQPVPRVAAGAGGGRELGCVAVVEELGQSLGSAGRSQFRIGLRIGASASPTR
jgi:hypothetical protein